jgi:hypothetical protein
MNGLSQREIGVLEVPGRKRPLLSERPKGAPVLGATIETISGGRGGVTGWFGPRPGGNVDARDPRPNEVMVIFLRRSSGLFDVAYRDEITVKREIDAKKMHHLLTS